MGKVAKEQFYDFIGKILYYLSNYIDTTKISKNYSNAEYILTDVEENIIRFSKNDSDKIQLKPDTGVTITPIEYKLTGYKILNQICYVRNEAADIEDIKQTMFHELMHVGASKVEKENKKNIIYTTGLYSKNYKFSILNPYQNTTKYQYLNEAMTEIVAKFIYDRINDTEYNIVRKADKDYRVSLYDKGYFLLAFILLNYFEQNPKVLFEIYFNNNIELFKRILKFRTDLTIDELDEIITNSIENPDDQEIDTKIELLIGNAYRREAIKNKNVIEQYLM